jgi:flagellar assembly protein FliH
MSSERLTRSTTEIRTEPFLYLPTDDDATVGTETGGSPVAWNMATASSRVNIEQKEKEAFERGVKDGESRAREVFEKQLAAMRASAIKSLEEFKTQRETYFAHIEPEIVQLSLAIARKILHREAQMDPLLLTGMVHVALEKLDSGTRVRLRAHPADIHLWNEYFSQPGSFQPAPDLVGDPALLHGECALETEIGSTQVSLETQLKEIEQGFFDLLEHRPRVR